MYQSTSSSSSSQKSMSSAHGGAPASAGGLTRYGSAPGSFLTTAVDSVIGTRQPDSAATLRAPPSFGAHYFSSADSSVVESSRKVVQSSSTSNDLKSSSATAAALNRSYGFNDLALGDFSTGRNFNSNGGQSSSSSPLVRQRSSPAGFLGHLSVAEPNGTLSLSKCCISLHRRVVSPRFFSKLCLPLTIHRNLPKYTHRLFKITKLTSLFPSLLTILSLNLIFLSFFLSFFCVFNV